jgi:hypothetical protein
MVTSRGLVAFAVSFGISVTSVGAALAQAPAPARAPMPVPPRATVAPLVGVTEVTRVTTPTGFIDDVVAAEDGRIAYVVADTASKAELHVLTHATKQEQIVDLAPVTLHPVGLHLVGQRAFVIGRAEDGSHSAALVELTAKGKKPAGTVVYKIPAAASITVVTRDGKQRIAVYRTSTAGELVRHDVELLAIETGKRIAAARPFEIDAKGKNAKLDFTVNHWSDGMTRAYGIKAGAWDKKEDTRGPDVEATYDLITGTFSDKKKIVDLFEQRRRFTALAESGKRLDFIRLDISGLQLWRGGTSRAIDIDQPLTSYDPKSMQGIVAADGTGWVILKVDPVNAEAVARKKADPEYLDIFRVTADGKATRKARVLGAGVRHRFGVIGDRFWLLERNNGFERGGKSLAIYQLP